MPITKKHTTRFAVIIIIIVIGSYFVGYLITCSRDPYKVAINFIYKSPEINAKIGKVTVVTLVFLGYSVRYIGPSGEAEFKIDLKGEKGNGTAFVTLKKRARIWKITEATLKLENGDTMNLDNRTSYLQH